MTLLVLPEGWSPVLSREEASSLESELRRELPEGHVLCGRRCSAFATSDERDDVVFELEDGTFALVHLTWKQETDPTWPFTHIVGSRQELLKLLEVAD